MDFVKREDANVIDEESYKAYMENLQKSHQIDATEYQHTPISIEQLHQAMQSTLNNSNIIHNFQLPLSPRQMSTLMLKTNLTRNFTEIPAHLSRNLELDLSHSLANELPQNLRHEDILSHSLNRNIDISLVRSLGNEIDLQNAHALVQNMSEDLRMNEVILAQNLSQTNCLGHEIYLSNHLNRQNLEQELLHEGRRSPMVIQCVPDSHLLEQNLQRIDQSLAQKLDQNIAQRLDQNLAHRLEQNIGQKLDQNLAQRLDQNMQRLEQNVTQRLDQNTAQGLEQSNAQRLNQNIAQRLEQSIVQRLDQNIAQRLDQSVVQRLDQNLSQRLEQSIVQRLDQNLAQRLEQSITQRLDQNAAQRLDQSVVQRLDQNVAQRLEHSIVQRSDQNIPQRLDHSVVQRLDQNIAQRLDQSVVQRLDQIGQRLDQGVQRLDQRLVNGVNERQLSQNDHVLPMQFHIKSEQEDDGYYYENVNQGMANVEGIDGHMPAEHSQTSQPSVQTDSQIYSIYTNQSHATSVPALNPIDLYSRNSYAQNYTRENPQNLVIHRQYDNISPYPEEIKKLRQDGVEIGAKTKNEEPKENLKPSNQNKIYEEKNESNKLTEELSMNIKGEYVCYKCNVIFPSKRGLKQHAKTCVETEESEKVGKFGCSHCAYKCQSPAILKIHERTHSGEKPFSCNFCDYKSGQKNNVAKHILVHMKEKPFRCQFCAYRCAQKNNLVVHERTHTGYKPFACPYCDYRTVQKPNLVKHMYLHTDQKPFSCDMCNYRCVQKTNLTKHKQRHLNDKEVGRTVIKDQKPYRPRQKSVKCLHCPYRCVQKSSMDKHMQFKHGLEFNGEVFDQGVPLRNDDGQLSLVEDDVQNLSVKKESAFAPLLDSQPIQLQS